MPSTDLVSLCIWHVCFLLDEACAAAQVSKIGTLYLHDHISSHNPVSDTQQYCPKRPFSVRTCEKECGLHANLKGGNVDSAAASQTRQRRYPSLRLTKGRLLSLLACVCRLVPDTCERLQAGLPAKLGSKPGLEDRERVVWVSRKSYQHDLSCASHRWWAHPYAKHDRVSTWTRGDAVRSARILARRGMRWCLLRTLGWHPPSIRHFHRA